HRDGRTRLGGGPAVRRSRRGANRRLRPGAGSALAVRGAIGVNSAAELNELTEAVAAMGSPMVRVQLPVLPRLPRYTWGKFRDDLIAGATLTLVSIPQAIGFSLILNLPPTPVIAAVMIGGFVGAMFFSSHHHVFGPTSSISLIVAATVAAHTSETG